VIHKGQPQAHQLAKERANLRLRRKVETPPRKPARDAETQNAPKETPAKHWKHHVDGAERKDIFKMFALSKKRGEDQVPKAERAAAAQDGPPGGAPAISQQAQVQADDPRVDLAMVLTKNQSLAKKSVDSLVGWVQGIQDPPTQKELIVNLLNHSSLTERTLDILEADCARMPENPFSPEWFLLRRGLYRVLPRVLRY
jgi:hypothetical protein